MEYVQKLACPGSEGSELCFEFRGLGFRKT